MTERKHEDTSPHEGQRAKERQPKDRGTRPTQRQGQAHYYTKPFSFALELGFFAGFIWGGYTGYSTCCILRLYLSDFWPSRFSNINIYIPRQDI